MTKAFFSACLVLLAVCPAVTAEPPPLPREVSEAVGALRDPDSLVRESAAERLKAWGRAHPEEAGRLLDALRAFEGCDDPDIRARCGDLRREWSDPLPRLLKESLPYPGLHAALAGLAEKSTLQALHEVAKAGSAEEEPGRGIAVRALAVFLRSPDWQTRGAAAQGLGLLDSPAARGFLTEVLPGKEGWRGSRQEGWVFQVAMQSLSKGGGKSRGAIPRLALSLEAEGALAGDAARAMAAIAGLRSVDGGGAIEAARGWWKAHRNDPEWKENAFLPAAWPEGEPPFLRNANSRFVPIIAPPAQVGQVRLEQTPPEDEDGDR